MKLKEAYEKAIQEKSNINHYVEYKKSYVFSYDDGNLRRGGDSPIVVPKDGSESLNMAYAVFGTDLIDENPLSEGAI